MTLIQPKQSILNKIQSIQDTLRKLNIDGWLFYDFWKRNEFAQRILKYPSHGLNTRRFFYLIPAQGQPRKLLHTIEQWDLDHLPGDKTIFLSWQSLEEGLQTLLDGVKTVAMEYSPENAIPYVSKVDAGTIEMVRRTGVEVVSSMNLIQYFESRWTEEAYNDNLETAKIMRNIVDNTFAFIKERLTTFTRQGRASHSLNESSRRPLTEYDVQQFMVKLFQQNNLVSNSAPNCSVNANSANPHYEPTKERHSEVHEGDFVLLDLWAKKNKPGATYNDITWVGYVGSSVPERYDEIFQIVKGARDSAVDFLNKSFAEKKTIRGCDVDDIARGYISQHGYGDYFIHRTGHSITEDLHGSGANIDNLETKDERILIPETAFSIEPGIYLPDEFGIRSEINVYISKDYEVIVPGEPRQQEVVAILR